LNSKLSSYSGGLAAKYPPVTWQCWESLCPFLHFH